MSSPQLRDAFNTYLKQIRADGTYDTLVRKYYPGIQRYFPEFFARKK
jgi:ABC-type amino acid transport substrate-binding protein